MVSNKQDCIFDSYEIASRLLKGSAALFPTDTLPALAASPQYVSQLWKLKLRPREKPLILMAARANQLFDCVLEIALPDAELMARRYWPGALTMILPASGPTVDALNSGNLNLGMRVPDCEAAIELLSKSGPLATTSANLGGADPSLNAEEASACFPGLPLLGPLPWPIPSGKPSTVLLWRGRGAWQVLRSGALIIEDLKDQ